jgi:hypothetical protein
MVHLLRGFYFDGSSFDRCTFYVYAFVQPLYVPLPTVTFQFGIRLTGKTGQAWEINPETEAATMMDVLASIKNQGLPFIGRIQTPGDLAEYVRRITDGADNPNNVEVMAYSLALADRNPEALQALDQLQQLLQAQEGMNPWLVETFERSQELRERLATNPKQAIALLDEWTEQTRARLRLPKDSLV